jgi:hypothetical protein
MSKRTSKRDQRQPKGLQYRAANVVNRSIDEDARTVRATVATETPVAMPDWERMEMVDEVLLARGADIPKSRQVPFLDSHQRMRVRDQLGSARELTREDGQITATMHFASTAEAEFSLVREGHVTDVSAGYEVIDRIYIPEGKTRKIKGREFTGPVNVVTRWKIREVSLTPIGADEQAKLRGLDPAGVSFDSPEGNQQAMNEELRNLLEQRGMPKGLDDAAAFEWMLADERNRAAAQGALEDQDDDQGDDPAAAARAASGGSQRGVVDEQRLAELIARETQRVIEERDQRQNAWRSDVRDHCELADMPGEYEHCLTLGDIAAVRAYLTERKADRDNTLVGSSVRIVGEGFERLQTDMGHALALRAMRSAARSADTVDLLFPADQRSRHVDSFRFASLYDMAQEFVRAMGVNTRGLSREQVAICAMFGPEKAGIRGAYHVTGSFANLTLDAMNKSMQVGYTEAPQTWRGPMRQGDSVPDFKDIHRLRLGAVPNLPIWNDNSDPTRGSMADGKETYAVESRSLEIGFSYRLLVNDDMSVLTRTGPQMGAAAARTVNAVAWGQVTSNPTMSDNVALFSAASGARKRSNLETGAGAPATATLQTLSNKMMQMRGENTPEGEEGDDILDLMPRYIVGPSALKTTIEQLVLSAYDPAANKFQVYNTATQLIPVIEPRLDAASTTAWYLFADPSQIDTVEVTFLTGQESPVVREFMDERNLSQNFTILQTFGAKPLNHRGIQKHAGA